jgi:ubiquinone biosynthesis protein
MIAMRFLRISWVAAGLLGLAARERLTKTPPQDSSLPSRLREALDGLGPTFVKLGQALSLRRDLLPDSYLVALRGLQDQAGAFPAELARAEIERGLDRKIEQMFSSFEVEPFAAASIAQVHRAQLHDGRAVIVKVRRPGIRAQIDSDMRTLIRVFRLAVFVAPGLVRYQPEKVAREIWMNLRRETDLHQEARSIRRFAEAFKERSDVYIPAAISNLCAEAVLVQELSHGRSINEAAVAPDGPRLAGVLVDFYLQQFFIVGLFHGDPHPGNLFVMEDGRICFHDFGLVGFLDRRTRRNLGMFMQAFVHQDAAWMLDAATNLGLFAGPLDRAILIRGIEEILTDFAGSPLKDWSIAEAFLRVMRLGSGEHVTVPYNLVVLMRTLFLVESALRTLDPAFNVLETLLSRGEATLQEVVHLSPETANVARLKAEMALTVQDLPALVAGWLHRAQEEGGSPTFNLHIPEVSSLEKHVDRSANRLALAAVALGLFVAGSLLMQHSLGPRVFGDLPLLGMLAYALALWLSFRLLRAISRSGQL